MTFELFRHDEMERSLAASAEGKLWLLGAENATDAFAGIWTRVRRDDILTQPWKWHDAGEVEMILQGQLHLQIANDTSEVVTDVELSQGDIFYIGNGVRHRADAVGTETCVGLLVCPKAYSIASGQPFWTE